MLQKILYYSDFVLVPLAAMYFILASELTIGSGIEFVMGVLCWSFLEYVLHRLTHFFLWSEHFRHHAEPKDPSAPSIFLILPLGCFAYLIGTPAFVAGFLSCYGAFIVLHWSYHHLLIPRSSLFWSGKKRHDQHHAGKKDTYGVVTGVWDKVFPESKKSDDN